MPAPDLRTGSRQQLLPSSPQTIAALRSLSADERRAFMERADSLLNAPTDERLVAALDHHERNVTPVVADCLWRAATELNPAVNQGTRAYIHRSRGERFDVIVRSVATLAPPGVSTSAGKGLLTQVEGRAVPYNSFEIVGYFEEAHAYGSLDGYTHHDSPPLPLMLNHGRDDPWPIGRSQTWRNQPDGLHGVWSLNDSTNAQRAGRHAQSGEMAFMSISFVPIRSIWDMHPRWDPTVGDLDRVTRTESRLVKTSIVATPAFAGARVTAVRSAAYAQQRSRPVDIAPNSPIAWRIEHARLAGTLTRR